MKTLVMWDINGCPIPDGFDPRLVGRRIESALKNAGYCNGPLTITAIGNLTQVTGENVLRKLSSTGIALTHGRDIYWPMREWTRRNPSPATIMLIFGPYQLELFADKLQRREQEGYRILLAYPKECRMRGVSKKWLWKSLLEDEVDSGSADNKHETTRLVLPDLCPETDESPWYCSVCDFAAQSIEDLTTHLKSVKHAYKEWDLLASHHGVNRLNVKPEPPNNDPDTIKEWELLYKADIEWRLNMIKMSQSKGPKGKLFIPQETCRKYEIMKQHNKKDNQTLVLWSINSCPIPDGYDSRLVRPRIESAVKNSVFYGPVTITAIGNLTKTPGDKVLRELSSTGIAFEDTDDVKAALFGWTRHNPSPATIMLISGSSQLVDLSPAIHELHFEGYTILLAYPQRDPAPGWLWTGFLRCVQEERLWKSLLEGEMDSGSADKTSETGESPRLLAQAYEDYIKSKEYAHSTLFDAKALMENYKKKLKNRRTPNDHLNKSDM